MSALRARHSTHYSHPGHMHTPISVPDTGCRFVSAGPGMGPMSVHLSVVRKRPPLAARSLCICLPLGLVLTDIADASTRLRLERAIHGRHSSVPM
eukprot:2854744-Rhodomonas_salina.1